MRRRVEESYRMSSVSGTVDYESRTVSDRLHIKKDKKILGYIERTTGHDAEDRDSVSLVTQDYLKQF